MSFKDQLIKLGHEKPELRDHLRPILDTLTKKASFRKGDAYAYVGDITDGEPTWAEVVDVMHNPDRRDTEVQVQLDVKTGHDFGRPKKLRPVWVYASELHDLSKYPLLT